MINKYIYSAAIFLSFSLLFSSAFISIDNVDLNSGSLDVYMSNDEPVGGFQFNLTDISITGANGGSSADSGFLVSTSATTVLGFSLTGGTIASGDGILLQVSFDGESTEICLEEVVISDASGNAIDVEVGDCFTQQEDILGCTDPVADNFNPDANLDDGSCEYSNGGPYFELDIDTTGESHLIIFQDTIIGLENGDEVGVFDVNGVLNTVEAGQTPEYGEVLVGTGVWNDQQLEIAAIMSLDLSDFNGPVLAGAVDGNTVIIKIYDVSSGQVINTDPTFSNGGEFGDLFTVIPDLGIEDSVEPVYGCTDASACNFDSDATDDDGSCEYPDENFDCNGNCIVDIDCFGQCGGDAVVDECGECGGQGADFECWDGSLVCESIECPDESSGISILYDSYDDIGGFQFNLDNVTILSAGGGAAEAAGFLINSSSTTVIGFSLTGAVIPSGSGVLVDLEVEGSGACLSDVVISDPSGNALDISIVECLTILIGSETIFGCTDQSACNYSSDATDDDGTCEYPEENFDCDGNCIVEVDCSGECGGDAVIDECGECGGDGSSCQEEFSISFGNVNEEAGIVEILMTNSLSVGGFQMELSGINIDSAYGGSAEDNGFTVSNSDDTVLGFSLTGSVIPSGSGVLVSLSGSFIGQTVCFEEVILSSSTGDSYDTEVGSCWTSDNVLGCTDEGACNYNPDANLNDGSCFYPEDNGWCDCEGNIEDCNGECGGDALVDECGECGGNNSSCTGCTDPEAENYDPEAIVSCDDCCEYPSYDGVVVINEINYNPASSFDQSDTDYEFVELYNNSEESISLNGWNFSSTNINFTFNDSHFINAGDYLVLARNADTYPGSVSHNGTSLLNNGETLTLTDLSGQLVDIVTYSDGFQGDDDTWPQGADAEGATLELIDPNTDNNLAESWQDSYVIPGGTPGYENSSTPDPVYGCTDLEACNYDPDATDDDGSCSYPEDYGWCDCNGNIEDCAGECGGSAEYDCAGDCNGDAVEDCAGDCNGNALEDCAGECNGSAVEDACGDCNGGVEDPEDCPIDGYSLSLSNVDIDAGTLEIVMNNESDVGGFQFDLSGVSIIEASGGSAEENGFLISTSSTTVLGFSLTGGTIPSGNGVLLEVLFEGSPDLLCIEELVLSDPNGSALDATVGECYEQVEDEPYYSLSIDSTGESHLVILQNSITSLDSGDEVGIFDTNGVLYTVESGQTPEYGEVLVGTGVWNGSQLEIAAIMSLDLSDFNGPVLAGAVDGNEVVVKVYDSSESIEMTATPTITNGGSFGDLFTVVSELDLGDDPEPVYGCTDDNACNYNPDATDDDGSCDFPEENFDCNGNCIVYIDCNGECGGDAVIDDCGVCDGENADIDDCGICFGDSSSCAVYIELEVTTTINESLLDDIDTFEENFCSLIETELNLPDGSCDVTSVTVLDRDDVEVSVDFTITLTEDELADSDFESGDDLNDAWEQVEDEIDDGLPEFVDGCTDGDACNYNDEATINDGSCDYPEENFDCDGNCIVNVDCNGECGGDAIEDCLGECGGDAVEDECGECNGDGSSCETYGCTDEEACNYDEDATVDDGSCDYDYDTYYLDTDGDGLGYGGGQEFCENPGNGWADNNEDLYPNCSSNYVDSCGICDGDDGVCSGCTDPEAFNANCLSGEFPDTATSGCGQEVVVDDGSCIYVPDGFEFNQSTTQAFYLVIDSQIDGVQLDEMVDWIGAFKDGLCVGSWPWVGAYTTLPVMGDDGSDFTQGYMNNDDIPEFLIFDGSTQEAYPAVPNADYPWANFEFYTLENINVYPDCNGDLGGDAFLDDCGVCSGGNSGHEANSDDVGCGCFVAEAVDYYFDADGDALGYGDSELYCSEIGDIFTENTMYDLVPDGWVLNNSDECPFDSENDIDGDGVCGDIDPCPYDIADDSDGDGYCDSDDECPYDADNDIDGDGVCGDVDPCPADVNDDSDGDGSCDSDDICPGFDDFLDTDGDSIVDCIDSEPNCATNDTDECGVCAGDNSTCSGCTDSEAFNYDCLTGNLPQDIVNGCGEDVVVDDGSCIYTPEGFEYNQSSLQAFYFVIESDLDEEPLEERNDWIAVFNGDVCVGSWPWVGPYTTLPAMGNDGEEYSNGYLDTGDFPTFKIYDGSTGGVYDAEPSDDIAWNNNGLYTLDYVSGFSEVSYDIDLHYGANLISFYALPEDLSLENIFSSVEGIVTGVIGEGVAATPNPDLGWVGSLSEIDPVYGYWVKMNNAGILDLTGQLTDPETVYDLHYGANLISYPFAGSAPIENTIPEEEWENIDGVIGEGVAATYNPVLGWVGSLSSLEGTKGYWFKVNQPIDFTYIPPSDLSRGAFISSAKQIDEYEYLQSSRQAFYFIESVDAAEIGDWILSYNKNVLVGSREWTGIYTDVPAMGYDQESYSIGYCETGDNVSFKLFRPSTGELFSLNGESIPVWEDNGIYVINSLSVSHPDIPNGFEISEIYPNPFNPSTTINFAVSESVNLSLIIYDMQGRAIEMLSDKTYMPGEHSVSWNAKGYASGIYFAKLSSNNHNQTYKLMLVK